MSVMIRLTRVGKKGERKFRIAIKEKRSKRDGKAIDIIGWYEKTAFGIKKEINKDLLKYWLDRGAKTSPTVAKLIEK